MYETVVVLCDSNVYDSWAIISPRFKMSNWLLLYFLSKKKKKNLSCFCIYCFWVSGIWLSSSSTISCEEHLEFWMQWSGVQDADVYNNMTVNYVMFWLIHCISKLQLQLQSLMETLSATEPHYIRCVKPNNVLKPAIFENLNIIQQLRCGVST